MALQVESGSFTVTTGDSTIEVDLSGAFTPVGILFFAVQNGTTRTTTDADATINYGVTDGTSQWSISQSAEDGAGTSNSTRSFHNDGCLHAYEASAAAIDYQISLDAADGSLDADGFTVKVDNNPAANQYVGFIAWGGIDCEVGTFYQKTSTGNHTVSLSGSFTPTFLMVSQMANANTTINGALDNLVTTIGVSDGTTDYNTSIYDKNNVGTTATSRSQNANLIKYMVDHAYAGSGPETTLSSFGSGEFVLNYSKTQATANVPVGYFVLGGVQVEVKTYNQKTSDGAHSSSGWSFTPEAALCMSMQTSTNANPALHANMVLGASDGTNNVCIQSSSEDDADVSDCATTQPENFVHFANYDETQLGDTDVTFSSNSMDFSWSNTDGTAREIVLVGFAEVAGGLSIPVAMHHYTKNLGQ